MTIFFTLKIKSYKLLLEIGAPQVKIKMLLSVLQGVFTVISFILMSAIL